MAESKKKFPYFLSIGCPLLDIVVRVDDYYMHRNKIKRDACIRYEHSHKQIFKDSENMSPVHQAGGSVTNTARVLQWLLPVPKHSYHIGAIGKDNEGKILAEILEKEKVEFIYQEVSENTGKSLVLVASMRSSIITDLGASLKLTSQFLDKKKVWEAFRKSDYIYTSALFFSISYNIVQGFGELCLKEEKTFILNIGGTQVCRKFKKEFRRVLAFAKILFGNEEELVELAKILNFAGLSFRELLIQVNLFEKHFKTDRITVITRGEKSVMMVVGKEVTDHPINHLSSAEYADKTGAGDAFVGGFMAKYMEEKPLPDCIKMGIGAAQTILKYFGCSSDARHEILGFSKRL